MVLRWKRLFLHQQFAGVCGIGATAQTASSWIAANEPHGQAGKAVAFVSYGHGTTSTGNPGGLLNNDFHVTSADMTARTNGVNLSAYFSTDKDGENRPSSGAWDVGAFEIRQISCVVRHAQQRPHHPSITRKSRLWRGAGQHQQQPVGHSAKYGRRHLDRFRDQRFRASSKLSLEGTITSAAIPRRQ